MEKINFIKMHGLGNDFVIIDKRHNNINITKDLISKLSDRKTGAGCDQLITINPTNKKNIHANIKIYNPAGDSAEACGNGTRCVAKLLFDESNKNEIRKGGVVNDPKIHKRICDEFRDWFTHYCKMKVCAIIPSPIKGPKGNIEFLLYAKKL